VTGYLERRTAPMKALLLLVRALVAGPARKHPLRIALPVAGVAIGVAAVAAIHHANRSVTQSFRDAAATLAGRSDFVVTGAVGVPSEALRSLAFLWGRASFAPVVSGTVVVVRSGEVVPLLGIDPGGDRVVRDLKVAGGGRPEGLLGENAVFVTEGFARRQGLKPGDNLNIVAPGVTPRVPITALF